MLNLRKISGGLFHDFRWNWWNFNGLEWYDMKSMAFLSSGYQKYLIKSSGSYCYVKNSPHMVVGTFLSSPHGSILRDGYDKWWYNSMNVVVSKAHFKFSYRGKYLQNERTTTSH